MTGAYGDYAVFVAKSVLNAQLIPDSVLNHYRLINCEGLDLRLHLLLTWKRDSPNSAVTLFCDCLKNLMAEEQV
jgi:hypothetical protein